MGLRATGARRKLAAAAALTAAAYLALNAARLATAMSGGTYDLPITAVLAGGASSAGGSLTNFSAIGGHGVPMAGGSYSLFPGPIGTVVGAQPDLTLAHAFPTPFIPSQGMDHITFTKLPSNVIIKVYSMSGHIVKTLEKNDSTDSITWSPVVNDAGVPLASGVYLFTVNQIGIGRKHGKIMVIR